MKRLTGANRREARIPLSGNLLARRLPFSFPVVHSSPYFVTVVRFPDLTIDKHRLLQACQELSYSIYRYRASTSEAPRWTNCITAIRYVLNRAANVSLPPVWIGDLPRILAITYRCELHRAELGELKPGDLLFLRRDVTNRTSLEEQWLVHVAMYLGRGLAFHSSYTRKGMALEHLRAPRDNYGKQLVERVIDSPKILWYIDPRNRSWREKFGEWFYVKIPREIRPKRK